MKYNFIKTNIEDGVFNLVLARPEKRNAFSPTMVNEIAHALDNANYSEEVKVLVVRAEGPVFCAGMDLKTFREPELDRVNPEIKNLDISLGEVFDRFEKPSVAIVEGDVIAGAFLIVLGCSYVFAKREVKFKLPEIELGIFPFQVMASLLRVMSEKKVFQLCLDTNPFDAMKAKDLGIVDEFDEDGASLKIIEKLKEYDGLAVSSGMRALKKLSDTARSQQYSDLKKCLEELRNRALKS